MDPKIIVALISAAGVVISALVSLVISRNAAKKEIEKMKLEWEREDVVSTDDEYAAMASAVASYLHSSAPNTKAVSTVAAIRSKENGDLASLLDKLYKDLTSTDKERFQRIESDLGEVIAEKRKRKSK